MDKLCSRCKTLKPEIEFSKKRNGLQPFCKECQNLYRKQHYSNNKRAYIRSAKRVKVRLREFINEFKRNPCTDCGGFFPSYVMDFDHRDPATKEHSVARLANLGSKEKILEEISKCDLVCANCHRIRTHSSRYGI